MHDYGDICQAITEVAVEEQLPITTEEFHVLNRCLDTAIAGAVTEHARITADTRSTGEIERSGQLAHEVRDLLNTALLAFHTLKRGTVAINGSTGTVLGRSLINLRDLVDSTLSDIRMSANIARQERVPIAAFIDEIALAAQPSRGISRAAIRDRRGRPALAVNTDPQLLASAMMNLLNNAFKFTPAGGHVVLRAVREGDRVLIEVEDQCGGIPKARTIRSRRSPIGANTTAAASASDCRSPGRRSGLDGGDISFRNLPGTGCVFVIDMPPGDRDRACRSPAQET